MDVLPLCQRLLAIAQSGKTFGKDSYDQERYQEIETIALTLTFFRQKKVMLHLRSTCEP